MFSTKMTVIGGVAVVSLGVAAAVSLLGAASPKAETVLAEHTPQIDMTRPDIDERSTGAGVTRAGCVKPARPDWVKNAGPRDTNKVSLLIALYDIGRKSEIISTQTCECSTEYPSWDKAEKQLNQLISGIDNNQLLQILDEKTFEAGDLNKPALDVCAAFRKQ